MKMTLNFRAVLMAMIASVLCILSACEEHDGIDYFKSKCLAELNGQSYIDQTPFTISPDVIITPEIVVSDGEITFFTLLRPDLKEPVRYAVHISLFIENPDEMLNKELTFEKVDIPSSDSESNYWDYTKYCGDNKISYARIDREIAAKGTFKFTSYDREQGKFKGTFTLQFSEGTMHGQFEL